MASYSSLFFHIPQLTSQPSTSHLRSFLSLDVADSVRRTSSASSTFSFLDPRYDAHTPTPPSRASSASSSSSSQRSLPRPKPAPKVTIPAVPISTPRSRPRAARSQDAPRRRRPSPSPAPPLPAPAPIRPLRPTSILTATSTVSTHYRSAKRTDALARLEGRAAAQPPRPLSPPPYSPHAAVHRTKSAAPVLATKSFMPFSDDDSDSDDYADDAESDVRVELVAVPSSPDILEPQRHTTVFQTRAKRGRSRAGTIESWFVGPPPASAPAAPKNFMDMDPYDRPARTKPYLLI